MPNAPNAIRAIPEHRTVEIRNGHDLITWTSVPGPIFAKEFADDLNNKVFKQIREAAHEQGAKQGVLDYLRGESH